MAQQRQRNSRGQFTDQSLPPAAPQERQRACRGSSSTAAIFSLLAGAGVGLAAMYLFDPEAGADRRRRLADRSHELLESSKDLAHDAAQSAGSTAQTLGGQIAGKAASVAEL